MFNKVLAIFLLNVLDLTKNVLSAIDHSKKLPTFDKVGNTYVLRSDPYSSYSHFRNLGSANSNTQTFANTKTTVPQYVNKYDKILFSSPSLSSSSSSSSLPPLSAPSLSHFLTTTHPTTTKKAYPRWSYNTEDLTVPANYNQKFPNPYRHGHLIAEEHTSKSNYHGQKNGHYFINHDKRHNNIKDDKYFDFTAENNGNKQDSHDFHHKHNPYVVESNRWHDRKKKKFSLHLWTKKHKIFSHFGRGFKSFKGNYHQQRYVNHHRPAHVNWYNNPRFHIKEEKGNSFGSGKHLSQSIDLSKNSSLSTDSNKHPSQSIISSTNSSQSMYPNKHQSIDSSTYLSQSIDPNKNPSQSTDSRQTIDSSTDANQSIDSNKNSSQAIDLSNYLSLSTDSNKGFGEPSEYSSQSLYLSKESNQSTDSSQSTDLNDLSQTNQDLSQPFDWNEYLSQLMNLKEYLSQTTDLRHDLNQSKDSNADFGHVVDSSKDSNQFTDSNSNLSRPIDWGGYLGQPIDSNESLTNVSDFNKPLNQSWDASKDLSQTTKLNNDISPSEYPSVDLGQPFNWKEYISQLKDSIKQLSQTIYLDQSKGSNKNLEYMTNSSKHLSQSTYSNEDNSETKYSNEDLNKPFNWNEYLSQLIESIELLSQTIDSNQPKDVNKDLEYLRQSIELSKNTTQSTDSSKDFNKSTDSSDYLLQPIESNKYSSEPDDWKGYFTQPTDSSDSLTDLNKHSSQSSDSSKSIDSNKPSTQLINWSKYIIQPTDLKKTPSQSPDSNKYPSQQIDWNNYLRNLAEEGYYENKSDQAQVHESGKINTKTESATTTIVREPKPGEDFVISNLGINVYNSIESEIVDVPAVNKTMKIAQSESENLNGINHGNAHTDFMKNNVYESKQLNGIKRNNALTKIPYKTTEQKKSLNENNRVRLDVTKNTRNEGELLKIDNIVTGRTAEQGKDFNGPQRHIKSTKKEEDTVVQKVKQDPLKIRYKINPWEVLYAKTSTTTVPNETSDTKHDVKTPAGKYKTPEVPKYKYLKEYNFIPKLRYTTTEKQNRNENIGGYWVAPQEKTKSRRPFPKYLLFQ